MIDPISVCLSFFVAHVMDGILGNEAHQVMHASIRRIAQAIDGDAHERLNHDIARNVRLSHLAVLEQVLDAYAVKNAGRWERQGGRPVAFEERAAAFCRDQRELANTNPASLTGQATATLEAAIDSLLARQPSGTLAAERAEAMGTFAEAAVLGELHASLPDIALPDDFEAFVRPVQAGAPHPFLSYFTDQIGQRFKNDGRFRDIVLVSGVAEVKAQGFEITEILLRVERQFGAARTEFLSALREVGEVLTDQGAKLGAMEDASARRHRELMEAIAREKGVDPRHLVPLFEHLGHSGLPLDEIRARASEAVEAILDRSQRAVAPSNDGADIAATIGAARSKLGALDTGSARSILTAKIAEEAAARRQRLVPLLEERVAIERLSYDHEAAETTLEDLIALDPDNMWNWIALGDLHVTTGALRPALDAFRRGAWVADHLAQADPGNAGWQRDLATSNERLGDTYFRQEKRDAARQAFERALSVYSLLITRHPDDAQSLVFSVVPHLRLAELDASSRRDHLETALAILKPLAEANRLDANRLTWIPQIEDRLAAPVTRLGA